MSQVHLPWEVVRRFPKVAHRLWVPEDDGRCFFARLVGYMKVTHLRMFMIPVWKLKQIRRINNSMLKSGLYEQVINRRIAEALARTDKLKHIESIDAAEAAKVLAKYLSEVL